jgi:quercetin dioxygenase-like cupin family protein
VRDMTDYTKLNLDEVKDLAPDFGMQTMGQARFARQGLGAERIGLADYQMNPGQRVGFGHRHAESEEMYVVLSGSGRFRVDDQVLEVGPRDVVYCPPQVLREWEAGPDGMEVLAFGAHTEGGDAEMVREFWTD